MHEQINNIFIYNIMSSSSAAATLGRTPTNAFNLAGHPYHGSLDCRSNFSSLARVVNEQLQHQSTFHLALTQIDNCAEHRQESRPSHNEAHKNAIMLIRNLYKMVEYALSKPQFVRFALSFGQRPMSFTLVCINRDGSTDTLKATVNGFDKIATTHARRNSTRRQRKQKQRRKNTRSRNN
jgi:hypothetical protein